MAFMKFRFLFLLLLNTAIAGATNYFVNPSSDSTKENGTKNTPWKSINSINDFMKQLRPGDTVFLRRGELYFDKLNITCSGTEASPIVFTGYGEHVKKPIFMYKAPSSERIKSGQFAIRVYKSSYLKFEGLEITDDHLDKNDHASMALIKIAFSIDESNHISIVNCDMSSTGIGVNIVGGSNLVANCSIKNMRMIVNTNDGGYDDYGANGVVIGGSNNEISDCVISDCWANSYDFEFDGGAFEMAGPDCSNNRILRNMVYHCNGFMEMGSSEPGATLSKNYVADNIVINCGDLLYINNDGPFAASIKQLEMVNNVFIQSVVQLTKPKSMIAMRKASSDTEILVLANNIFWLPMQIDVVKSSQFEGNSFVHTKNIFYLGDGKLNFEIHSSEKILQQRSEIFKKYLQEPFFNYLDFFPFRYLLKYWYLVF